MKDNCGDSSKVVIASEVYTDYGCDSATLLGKVTRQLIASDQWGIAIAVRRNTLSLRLH